jgi:hypothetical protein
METTLTQGILRWTEVEKVDGVIVQRDYWDTQADDLHTFMTLDLAGTGFDLYYETTQDQGQSRAKVGSLEQENVIGGRSRSTNTLTELTVNRPGYGNWTSTNTTGSTESTTNYEFTRKIANSYWYGRQSDQVTPSLQDWLPGQDLIYFLMNAVRELDIGVIISCGERELWGLSQFHLRMIPVPLILTFPPALGRRERSCRVAGGTSLSA